MSASGGGAQRVLTDALYANQVTPQYEHCTKMAKAPALWGGQAAIIEPVDPSEGGHFQILHVAPRPLAMNEFGFIETVNRLGEGVVV
ncbi:hypothetical protein LX82_02733 [Celeribacter halophilus]|uniref:Uncharacterized protein n=1 Tax=Celeribacter halophilus TaxID=576117 RepID=A0A1I3V0N7_9RHOB|nr:hypothetical protein LX82_02733 [Celeribacter halophilus]SFJ87916.1 hypothetical protein SAMN04488138_1138 [Celeribacter halophilus]